MAMLRWYNKFAEAQSACEVFVQRIFGEKELPPSKEGRRIPLRHAALLDSRTGKPYISNNIRSSRYTIYDFVPKQIIFQATRLSNFYFIVIGIPQTIPGFSTTGNYTTILPLVFFMVLTILKEGYDDFRRHRLDLVENKGHVLVYNRPGRFRKRMNLWADVYWRDVQVGDIVHINEGETFPADVILLNTSSDSIAYIETMALDGETSLKSRQAPAVNHSIAELVDSDVVVTVEDPNRDLYTFNGRIENQDKIAPLTSQEVVYRGSVLKNTHHAIALVINTGEECKIRMNANHHPAAKKPRLERYSNQVVLTLIVYVIILSVGCSIGYLLWQSSVEQNSWYLNNASVPFKQIIIGYGIMFNNVIPLAMYVSLEIVKIGQMLIMSSDIELYDEKSDRRVQCNTNTILENLGQVSFVLTDKTGTLTENVMKFRGISVGGQAFFHETVTQTEQSKKSVVTISEIPEESEPEFPAFKLSSTPFSNTKRLIDHIKHHPASGLAVQAKDFLLAMALCHTCIPNDGEYQASSPDELALVLAARELGFVMTRRDRDSIQVGDVIYKILEIVDFSSKRKRMSIILQRPDGCIWLICKGADNMLIPRLDQAPKARASREMRRSTDVPRKRWHPDRPSIALERIRQSLERPSQDSNQGYFRPRPQSGDLLTPSEDVFSSCFQHLEHFAMDGLRTLMFAHRVVPEVEYQSWKKVHHDACTSLHDRQDNIEAAGEQIEHSLRLLGVTAIEDKLQEHVPQTIDKFRRANIRVWMLTGDKRETAINIAHAAKICLPESTIYKLDVLRGDLEGQMQAALEPGHNVAVIDGNTLSIIEQSPDLTQLFLTLIPHLDSAICCRASPSQKADLVRAIQAHGLTLAVGDGANDIAMIQAAHVGVGISGKEGLQAARVADYSVAQFYHLQRLLFVHGRWNYIRTAKFILWTFWKEMFFYMMQALFQRSVGYSGSSLYENWSLTALNTLFTSLCVILPGIFEQDLGAETLLAVPELYAFGQKNRGLNLVSYLMWMAGAAIEGILVWFLASKAGYSDDGAFALGNLCFTLAIIWTNWKLLLVETHYKTMIIIVGFLITVAGWWVWNIFLAGVYSDNLSPFDVRGGLFYTFGRDPNWWLDLLVTLIVLALLDLTVKAARKVLVMNGAWPPWKWSEYQAQERELEVWQELEKREDIMNDLRKRYI